MLLVFLLFGHPCQQAGYDLTVYLTGIKPHKGNIAIAVFNNEKDFLVQGKEYRMEIVKANENPQVIVFKKLPEGEYAISVYQDENGDGKMNRNFIGLPKEIYGFSKNFRPVLSKPDFDDCKFILKEEKALKIEIK